MKDAKEPVDLKVRPRKFALRFIRLYSALPKATEAQVIGKQVLRPGTSFRAQYREASRSRSTAEFVSDCGLSLRKRLGGANYRSSPVPQRR